MAFKKKLYRLNPDNTARAVVVQQTKREKRKASVTGQSNECHVREILANKLSGTHMGLWLLVPEYLRLGTWDLLKGTFDNASADDINTRIGLQMVNESALCVNRLRVRGSLCNQGFSLANGLSFLAADETVHELLDSRTVQTYEDMQVALMQIRGLRHHYDQQNIISIDPHRICSATQRIMPCKKKQPDQPAHKMLQTFFCADAFSGQPLGFTNGSSGKNCSAATRQLIKMIEQGGVKNALLVADKEHFTREIGDYICQHPTFDILMPAPSLKKVCSCFDRLEYKPLWAGYAVGKTIFQFEGSPFVLQLIVQRQGEIPGKYNYKPFLTTSSKDPVELLSQIYPQRWTIEEFFNFNGDMGWNRASTFNLNIRYGKQTMALLAQAATHQLKNKLPQPYQQWDAAHIAQQLRFRWARRANNETYVERNRIQSRLLWVYGAVMIRI